MIYDSYAINGLKATILIPSDLPSCDKLKPQYGTITFVCAMHEVISPCVLNLSVFAELSYKARKETSAFGLFNQTD